MPGRETDDSHATRLPTPRGAQAPSPQPPFPRWVFSDAISSRGTGDGVGWDSPRATDPLRKEPGSVCVPQSQTETGPLSAHQAGRSTPWAGGARAQSRESVLLWRRPLWLGALCTDTGGPETPTERWSSSGLWRDARQTELLSRLRHLEVLHPNSCGFLNCSLELIIGATLQFALRLKRENGGRHVPDPLSVGQELG